MFVTSLCTRSRALIGRLFAGIVLCVSATTVCAQRTQDGVRELQRRHQQQEEAKTGPVPFNSIRDALEELRRSSDPAHIQRVFDYLPRVPVKDHDDVTALYAQIRGMEAGPTHGSSMGTADDRSLKIALDALANCKRPEHGAAIKELLDRELGELPPEAIRDLAAVSGPAFERESRRNQRLAALTTAASKGQNEDALPTLRALRKKGGQAGKIAEAAIGSIGKDEDLEEFVQEIKDDPRSLVSISEFGRKGYLRVLREINDPNVSMENKTRLLGACTQRVDQADLPEFVKLLKSKNPDIVDMAARVISNNATSADEKLLRTMLTSDDRAVRGAGILALDRLWDAKYLADIVEVLKNDDDASMRSRAAFILETHHVSDAKQALREAAEKDRATMVRDAANHALKALEK